MTSPNSRRQYNRAKWWRRGRQLSQALFLLLFLGLLLWTRQTTANLESHALFFRLDPLAGLASMIAGREWIIGMVPFLLVVVLALLAGRVWCGWICPLGTLLDYVPSRQHRTDVGDLPSGWRAVKYGLLTFIFVGAFAGSLTLIVLDPITLLLRSMAVVVLPVLDGVINGIETILYGIDFLREPIDAFDAFLRGGFLPVQPSFRVENIVVAVVFVAVLAANAIRPRFWCRYLCPLGALLALLARVSVVRHRVDTSACVKCGRCARVCPTGAIDPDRAYVADVTECTVCLDCDANCPTKAISFQPRLALVDSQRYDPSRRQFLLSMGVAVVGTSLIKAASIFAAPNQRLIRPPGVREANLLDKCIRCGQCLKVCPTGGLQPSLLTAGMEGIWTPVLVSRHGCCDYGCNACGQVCPTGAIPSLTLPEKRMEVIGLAVIDKKRCLPWAQGKPCSVCEEMCPIPKKAIQLSDIESADTEGKKIVLRRPEVNERHCIGCGACEYHCPIDGEAAIRIQRR